MYQEQRLAEILELLAEKKQLSAKDMIEHFQVSKDTIRRDFSILSERRLVQRTHGGIIHWILAGKSPPLTTASTN